MRIEKFLEIPKGEKTKCFLLFLNFFLIITTYYVVKPVRGALVISELGASSLPYIWALTAILLALFVGAYSSLLHRFSRQMVVTLTTFVFVTSLLAIRYFLSVRAGWLTAVFYIWGDIFSVVLVEQFWSFTNDIYDSARAKKLFAFIGSGGIFGGITGSLITSQAVHQVGTLNLVYVCVFLILIQWMVTLVVDRLARKDGARQVYEFTETTPASGLDFLTGFRLVFENKYVSWLLISVLLTQTVSSIIDFQFNSVVERAGTSLDGKTAFFGNFFLWMNISSLIVMLIFTRPIQEHLGVRAALLVLPLFNSVGLILYLFLPIPGAIFGTKLMDKSLNYSIQRASKELLYVPTAREIKYQAKAVIDMFVYRACRILSSAILIPLVGFLSLKMINVVTLSLVFLSIAVIWSVTEQYTKQLNGANGDLKETASVGHAALACAFTDIGSDP